MIPLICLFAVALSTWLLTRLTKPSGFVDACLFGAQIGFVHILLAGQVLSALHVLSSVDAWAGVTVMWLLMTGLAARLRGHRWHFAPGAGRARLKRYRADIWRQMQALDLAQRMLLATLLLVVSVAGAINLWLVVGAAPHNWDSMTCHLARVAYYLQQNHLGFFDANYWAQATHPKNSTLLFIFAFLVSGHNENLIQLVQYLSYWVAIVAIYGISRRIGSSWFGSMVAASVFGLLVECLMQASTTQNDLLAATIGCATYGLLAWRERLESKYLVLAVVATAMALGTKASITLALPPLALLFGWITLEQWRAQSNIGTVAAGRDSGRNPGTGPALIRRGLVILGVTSVVAIVVFTLPSGYVDNYKRFGHPIGPVAVRQLHSFSGQTPGYVLENGSKNLLRFAIEFVSLDGLARVPGADKAQHALRLPLRWLTTALGIDLEAKEATLAPFKYVKAPPQHEDESNWGVLGFGLVLPAVVLALIGRLKSGAARVLSIATLLFIVLQAFAGPFDPWRGRYFMIAAIFAVPVLSVAITRATGRSSQTYLAAVVLLGCISALGAVAGRTNSRPGDVASMDRMGQLTRNHDKAVTAALRAFDRLVPADAAVAVLLPQDSYEYPLFGKGLTRRLLPVNGFTFGPGAIPPEATFLFYSDRVLTQRRAEDMPLGAGLYLRKL